MPGTGGSSDNKPPLGDDDGDEEVVFEVRGRRFVVTKRVLRAFPESLLASLAAAPLLDRPAQVVAPNANGTYTIDRDPRYFGIILQLYEQDGWRAYSWPPPLPLIWSSTADDTPLRSSPSTNLAKTHNHVGVGERSIATSSQSDWLTTPGWPHTSDGGNNNNTAAHNIAQHITQHLTAAAATSRQNQTNHRRAAALVESILDVYTTQASWDAFCEEVAFYQALLSFGCPTVLPALSLGYPTRTCSLLHVSCT
eukprot:2751153-Pyramimonas_sp.AAC.2